MRPRPVDINRQLAIVRDFNELDNPEAAAALLNDPPPGGVPAATGAPADAKPLPTDAAVRRMVQGDECTQHVLLCWSCGNRAAAAAAVVGGLGGVARAFDCPCTHGPMQPGCAGCTSVSASWPGRL